MDKYNNSDIFVLDSAFFTTRRITNKKPTLTVRHNDVLESLIFLPESEGRKGEGGLRKKGYFKQNEPDKPLVTVITTVFNGDEFIEETILSVIDQTYDNIEYIIIDGGSTDRTVDIIRKYESHIDYWVSEKDQGMYDALNKGFRLASGELMNFCNSDDLFYSVDVIKKNVDEYKTNKFDCCYGGVEYIDRKGQLIFKKFPLKFRLRYIVTLGMPFAQPSFFWTRSLMLKTGIFNTKYKIASDYDLFGRLLCKSKNTYRVPYVVVKFRKYGESFGDKNDELASTEVAEIKCNLLKLAHLSRFVIVYLLWDRFVQRVFQITKKNYSEVI